MNKTDPKMSHLRDLPFQFFIKFTKDTERVSST